MVLLISTIQFLNHLCDGLKYRVILILSIYVSHHIMDLESPIFPLKVILKGVHRTDGLEIS